MSFCDWCLKIARRLRFTSCGDNGTAISISWIGYSCQAPLYNHSQQSFVHESVSRRRNNPCRIMSKHTLYVPCGSAKSPAANAGDGFTCPNSSTVYTISSLKDTALENL